MNLQKANRPDNAKYDFHNETGQIDKETEQSDELFDSITTKVPSPDEVTREIMIDMLSVERNFVLVNGNLIGGPAEKVLPSRNTNTNQNENFKSNGESTQKFAFPLFDTLPVPSYYTKKTTTAASTVQNDKELFELIEKFNFDAIAKNEDSLSKYMRKFRACLSSAIKNVKINPEALPLAMNQFVQVLIRAETNNLIKCSEFKNVSEFVTKISNVVSEIELSSLQLHGVEKAVQYGLQISHLKNLNKEENVNNLIEVHKFTLHLLKLANKKKVLKNASDQSKFTNFNDTYQLFINFYRAVLYYLYTQKY